MAHRTATVPVSPRTRARTRTVLRKMARAYLTRGQGHSLGLCWALSDAADTCDAFGDPAYNQVHRALQRRRPRYTAAFDPYWWSFGPQGVAARKRVLRALCLEFGVTPPKGL